MTSTKTEVDRTDLDALVAQIWDSNAYTDDFYTTGDRYNGKEYFTKDANNPERGFWYDLTKENGPLETAKGEFEKQYEVNAAYTALDAAISNLIPREQVNATALYEALNTRWAWSSSGGLSTAPRDEAVSAENTTAATWEPYAAARAEGDELLKSLFDSEGNATEENTADKQGEVDRLAAAMDPQRLVNKESYTNLYNYYVSHRDEAFTLLEQYDPEKLTASNYTQESWDAYTAAYTALDEAMEYRVVGGTQEDYAQLRNFRRGGAGSTSVSISLIDALKTARRQLASTADVTVSFSYVDHFAAKYPDLRTDTGTYVYRNEALTLSGESGTTLEAAIAASGIEFHTGTVHWMNLPGGQSNLSCRNPLLSVSVNGESYGLVYRNALITSPIQLHGGDVVRVTRICAPVAEVEGSSGYDSTQIFENMADDEALYQQSYGQLEMTAPSDGLRVGDKAAFSASVTGTGASSNLGQPLSAENITLFVSEPQETETIAAPTTRTTAVTGGDGSLEYVFTEPGWYTVAMFNVQDDIPTFTDVYDAVTYGEYYSLYGGDFALIHVDAAEDEAALIEQYRTEYRETAETYFDQFHDYDFEAGYYDGTFRPQYETLLEGLDGAATFKDLVDTFDSGFAALQESGASAMDHEAVIADLRADLAYLPGDLNTMDETYADLLTEIQTVYAGLNAHQRSLLTGQETSLLEQLAAMDADGLIPLARVAVTFDTPNGWPYNTDGGTINGTGGAAICGRPNLNWLSRLQPDGTIPEPDWAETSYYTSSMEAKAGDYVYVRFYLKTTDDRYWPMWSVDGEKTWNLFEPATYGGVDGYYLAIWQVPEDAAKGSAYHIDLKMISKTEYEEIIAAQDTEGLDEAKASAKAALQATYDGYDLSLYDADGQAALKAALDEGLKAIDAATTTTAVNEARQAALAAMASVRRAEQVELPNTYDSGDTVGQVHVIIENTTYDDAPFTGTIADGWYDLGENDTMMTMVLKVLQSKGYSWNGTVNFGDIKESDYDIDYLASISKDGKTLAEFTGGQKSGWMGTLNDWFVNEGFPQFSYKNGQLQNNDEIHIMYTCDYGEDLGGTWDSNDTSLEDLTIRGGTLTPSFDGDVTDYMLLISGERANVTVTPSAANKNYLVKTFLNTYNSDGAFYRRPETISVKSGDVIYVGVGEKGWPTMNTGGNPTRYTIQVYSLQEALSSLPDASAVTLRNYTTYGDTVQQLEDLIKQQGYTGDRSKLDALKERVTFYEEIEKVKDLLANIPDVDDLTTGDRGQVQAARNAYDDLDGDQKLYITIADVEKFNAAVKWMEEHGSSISGGTIAGVEEMPEEIGETGGGSITITPEASVNSKGEATAKVDAETVEQVLEQAAEDGSISTIVVAPEIDGDASKVTVELPKSSVSDIAGDSLDLTVSTPIAGMTIPSEGLSELAKQSGSTVSFTAESVTVTGAGGSKSDAIRLDVAVNGKSVDTVPGGLTVTVPAADAGSVLVLVAEDGTETIIRKSVTADGAAAGLVDGPCTVKVVDNAKTFTDTSGHWAEDAIDFASSRELFNGTSATAFSPNEEMTRAMLVTVLRRMEDEPETAAENAFADIPDDTWYTDAVIWASENGIVNGVAEGQFDPDANITREQLAAMMYRYADFLGMDTAASGSLSRFNDGSQVSSWASDAMKWAVGNGLISGKSSTILDPKGNATRAEVATILQRMTALMVK